MRDSEAARLLEALPGHERFATWHLVSPAGTLVGYGVGAIELLRAMRSTRRAARFLDALPDALLERAYSLVARHRSKLGRLVPDRAGPRRFP
jgi:predicted DCC family thiol-disulfide oxidoreductase YuxK